MADSQEFAALTPPTIDAVRLALSEARLAPYLATHRSPEYALRLYLWNGRLSKAFLFPLGICEISTRNAINRAFSAVYHPDWVLSPPFQLNSFSAKSHSLALERLNRFAKKRNLPSPSSDDLVAALTFDFWSNLFREDYDHLWPHQVLLTVFPNLPTGMERKDVQRHAAEVNGLRNRIAHHEPIHDRQDHGAKLNTILDLIGLISNPVRDFTRRHSTVMTVSRVPPSRYSSFPGRPLAQMNLRPPPLVMADDTLDSVIRTMRAARPELALILNFDGVRPAALTTTSAMSLAADRADALDGMIDFSELTARAVAEGYPLLIEEIDVRASSGDVQALFFPQNATASKPSVVLVRSPTKQLVGAILRPEVRL